MATPVASRPVARCDLPADLHAILDPGCALAICERPSASVPGDLVDVLDLGAVDDIDDTIAVADAALHVAVLLGAAGYPLVAAVPLAGEIGALVDRFSILAELSRARLRLEVVETDACRRFHADVVTIRMICTLRGPGTQWIEAAGPDAIEELPTGAVALFKGRLLAPEPTILHRSQPIAGTGVQRLVLVVDPAEGAGAPLPTSLEPAP